MIFSACYTAEPNDDYNLTEYAVRRGAETAIGWEYEIGETESADWNERFLDKLAEGYTVEDAALYADEKFFSSNTITDWIIEGNEANVVNLSGPYSLRAAKTLSDISDMTVADNIINMNISDGDLSGLDELIKTEYNYFEPEDYEVTVKPVNDNTFRVYYEKFINGFNTNSGFYAVIKDGELYYLKEKPFEYNETTLMLRTVEVSDSVIESAKHLAADEISDKYYITEQTVDKMIIDGKYCLVINTTYAVDYGTDVEAFSCKEYIYKL